MTAAIMTKPGGALTFTLKAEPEQRLDLSRLTPAGLAGLGAAAIAAIDIGTTKVACPVGEVFAVTGEDGGAIRFVGGSHRFDRLGEGLSDGDIFVEGDVGQRLGRAMTGGRIEVRGHCGPFAGSGMKGGTIVVTGDAGDDLGGPLAGETVGISGGDIRIGGAAGARAGDRMRRGVIVVAGAAGENAGIRMIAGTLVVGGKAGRAPGVLMKRGTLLLADGAQGLSPTFVDNGRADLIILKLLAKAFAGAAGHAPHFDGRPMRRLAGDTAVSGLGEIFIPL